jgi:hypothetical protein
MLAVAPGRDGTGLDWIMAIYRVSGPSWRGAGSAHRCDSCDPRNDKSHPPTPERTHGAGGAPRTHGMCGKERDEITTFLPYECVHIPPACYLAETAAGLLPADRLLRLQHKPPAEDGRICAHAFFLFFFFSGGKGGKASGRNEKRRRRGAPATTPEDGDGR